MKKKPSLSNSILGILVIAFLLTCSSCGGERVLFCGPNKTEPVVIQKNPNKAFPEYVKTHENAIKANINILDKVKILDLDASTKAKVTEFREKLDQLSIKTEGLLKANYLAYAQTPCDAFVKGKYFTLLENIQKDVFELEKLKQELTKVSNGASFGGTEKKMLLDAIGGYETNTKIPK
jgi:hypothetical protein